MASRLFDLDLDRVHFGDGGLERSGIALPADSLFSALCIEAIKAGGESLLAEIFGSVAGGTLRFTDALPYLGDAHSRRRLVPKPIARVGVRRAAGGSEDLSDSAQKKLAKRIQYLPVDVIDAFVAGQAELTAIYELQQGIGTADVAERAAIRTGKDDAEPYRVGYFAFARGSGLWVLASGTDKELDLFARLMEQLAHTGIGGERSSGYGRFTLAAASVPRALADRVGAAGVRGSVMSMSVSLPADYELDSVLAGATFRLVKHSGFVASQTYASTPRRKRDIYKFAAGSVFVCQFDGVIADVSGSGGAHPVYSYAKPVFFSLGQVAA